MGNNNNSNRRQWLSTALHSSALGLGTQLLGKAAFAAPFVPLKSDNKPEKTKLTIAVSGRGSFASLPLLVAEQLGFFALQGLDVEVEDMVGAARVQQSIFSGAADVASGTFEHVLALAAKAQPAREFVLQGRAPTIAFGVSSRNFPAYKQMSDLRGKRIGISAPGMASHMLAQRVLVRAGVDPQSLSFVAVGTAAGALAAMRSGQVDALSNIDPVMTMLELKGEVKIIADSRTLKGAQAVFGGPMPSSCLYASHDFLNRHPQTVQALSYAIVHALKWLQTAGLRDLMRTIPEEHLLGDRALYLAAYERVRESISTDGVISADAVRTALKVYAEFDPSLQPSKIDLANTFTNTFARKAKQRYQA